MYGQFRGAAGVKLYTGNVSVIFCTHVVLNVMDCESEIKDLLHVNHVVSHRRYLFNYSVVVLCTKLVMMLFDVVTLNVSCFVGADGRGGRHVVCHLRQQGTISWLFLSYAISRIIMSCGGAVAEWVRA